MLSDRTTRLHALRTHAMRTRLLLLSSLLSLSFLLSGGTQILRATRPEPLAKDAHFRENGVQGAMYSEPSLFGLPNYQADIIGRVQFPGVNSTTENAQGCQPYMSAFNPYQGERQAPVIALVRRGGCSFGTKALYAQQAQAAAIIVIDNGSPSLRPLPKMAGGDDTPTIVIPGMLILKGDGDIIAEAYEAWVQAGNSQKTEVWMSLHYSIIAPDDRVEFDFFTYPDEPTAEQFVREFADVMDQLGASVFFTPHYRIIDGEAHGCTGDCSQPDDLPCGNQCSNCGRYCRIDPDGDLDTRPTGVDQVREAARGKCVYQLGLEQNNPKLWWAYSNQRVLNKCNVHDAPDGSWKWDPACSLRAMAAVGIDQAWIDAVDTICTGNIQLTADIPIDLLENEIDWQYDWQPLTSPYLFVNNFTYFGQFGCPAPAGPSTCGPLSIICSGFLLGTAPPICGTVSNNCDPGVQRDSCGVCGGSAKEGDSCDEPKKFPIGPVIGVSIACCILIGAAVYWYMRRQNNKMRDDIDSLLKQYLPLEGQAGTNGKSQQGGQMRLINNLDTSDEPTDL